MYKAFIFYCLNMIITFGFNFSGWSVSINLLSSYCLPDIDEISLRGYFQNLLTLF